jgi:hypothetical protein
MRFIRCALLVLPLAIAAAAYAAPSPVGTWKGSLVIDDSKMTLADPAQIKAVKGQIASARKIQVAVTIKADKTFTGNPPPTSGTWTIKGNNVTLTSKGKPAGQVFVLSKDGKTMVNTLPTQQGISTKIVLKRS